MRNQGWREFEKRELIVAWSRHGGLTGGGETKSCRAGRRRQGHKVKMGP